jgi:PhnB protein
MSVNPTAEGYRTITPLLHVQQVDPLIEYLKVVLDAELTFRHVHEDGRVVNAEVCIGDSRLWLGEPWGGCHTPPGTHHLYVYVGDVDAAYMRALNAGAESLMSPTDQPWGDRLATVQDPSGIRWHMATRKETPVGSPSRHW